MKITKLKNGLTIIEQKRNSDSVAIEMQVNTGSNNEKQKGISHFLEHMMFEGTKTRTTLELANAIESLGGELNAATSNERTVYYIVILKKHFNKALEILTDLIKNPLFKKEAVEKERKIILEEIKMYNDLPNHYQWILFLKNLFKNHPAKHPIGGYKETVEKITQKDIINYHKKFYSPNNMTFIVSGIQNSTNQIKKYFKDLQPQNIPIIKIKKEIKPKSQEIIEKKSIEQSHIVVGYQTVPRSHKDSYTLDIIRAILAKGQSSRLFEELRVKRGLAYHLGAECELNKTYGYFAMYAGADKSNIKTIKEIFLKQSKLPNLTEKEIQDSKNYVEGHILLQLEKNSENADWIGYWSLISLKQMNIYIKNIKKITKKDIQRVIKTYFKNPTIIVLEQK
jgi:predicted Zn-dependent peptidase